MISPKQVILVPAAELQQVVQSVFRHFGVPLDLAEQGAKVIVAADLRGVESHGVSGVFEKYVSWFRNGEINPQPVWRILRETVATANIDADRGLGIMMAPAAMHLAIDKARRNGLGLVTLRGGRHLGMAGYHAMLALPHDMIGICMTASPPLMVPPNGRTPIIGTNPIAVAVPSGSRPAFVFDGAMSVTSGHNLRLARRQGSLLPGGLVADEAGMPVLDPGPVPSETRLLPLGSTVEGGSYKGFALACIVQVLTGVLSGSGFAAQLGFDVANHLLAAIDVAAFQPVGDFKSMMDAFLDAIKATPPVDGTDGVRIPGVAGWHIASQRETGGVPIDLDTATWLASICSEFGIDWQVSAPGVTES